MFTPNSNIKLLQGTRLTYGSGHTYLFDWEENQLAFFNSKVKLEYTKSNIVVIDGSTIKLNVNYAQVYDCDYMMFQNTDYSYIWFYAFIDKVTYISENVTSISYTIDVLQTWMFRYSLDYCFVERETVESDVIGEHLLPENLELGDYITTNYLNHVETDYNIIILASENAGMDTYFTSPTIVGNSAVSCYWANLPYSQTGLNALKEIIDKFSLEGKNNAIISIFLQPATYGSTQATVRRNLVDVPNRTLSTTVKNNKLYTYPYTCLAVETPQNAQLFKYEDLGNKSFAIDGGFGANLNLICYPTDYKGVLNNYEYSVSLGGFPLLPYTTNYYQNWLAQNTPSRQAQENVATLSAFVGVAGATLGVLGSVATGGASLGVTTAIAGTMGGIHTLNNTYSTIQSLTAQKEQAQIIPNTFNGSASAIDILIASRVGGIRFLCKSLKPEFLKVIDDYFSKFGYSINQVKKPNLKSRKYWNYIKTVETNLSTTINIEFQNEIKKLYENGITFWHGDYMYNYALDNSIGTPEPPDPPSPTYIEYAIFPQQNVRITQRQNGSYSHQGTLAIDYADVSPTYARMYAPFKVKVLAINVPLSNSNCVYFGSCDTSGNPKAVRCNDGVDRILTVMCMHDSDISNLSIGQIINSGDWFYNQGLQGDVTGSHVHMEVAEGWQTNRIDKGNPSWEIVNAIDQSRIWQLDSNWNTIIDTMGYNFQFVNGRGGNV